jgi:hypothetical protein
VYPGIYESFILFYKNKFQFSIETYVKSRRLVLASSPLYTCIVAKYIRALETGRKVHERKLSSLMKKMKESCKLDINQSVRENILSRQKLRENNVEGTNLT